MKKNVFSHTGIAVLVTVVGLSFSFQACAGMAAADKGGKAGLVVFQSDFGLEDGAVAEMKGVAAGISPSLKLYDITHEIPAYNIWAAAYRLSQTVEYWPAGTVFVSIVDPGVGSDRLSVVLKTKSGHYIVTPDNGTLTLAADKLGIEEVRQIDEAVNRRRNSEKSYTFYGRDVYAYTAARLASGIITFEQVGTKLPAHVVAIPYEKARYDGSVLMGTIPILDLHYGNVWTNIDRDTAAPMNLKIGEAYTVEIFESGKSIFKGSIPFANTFSDVPEGRPLMYYNSIDSLSFAVNMGSFAATYKVSSGGGNWTVRISK